MSANFDNRLGGEGSGATERPAGSPLRRLTMESAAERTYETPIAPPLPPLPPSSPASEPAKPKRGLPVLLGSVVGAFLLLALGGAAYLGYQFLLGHEDRATAAYAPANTWAYVALNTDPTSRAWLDAIVLARRAGIDDDLARLPTDSLQESGEDPSIWDAMIKPAIGGEIGFAFWPDPDGAGEAPRFAGIVMIGDEAKARESIETMLDDPDPTQATYREIAYQVNDEGEAAGVVDRALVMTTTAAAFEDIVDAHLDGALGAEQRFRASAGQATDDPLVFGWFDAPAIAEAVDAEALAARTSASVTGIGNPLKTYADAGITTVTIRADGDALRTVALSEGRPSAFPTTQAVASFASDVPASTLFFMASADLYDTVWRPMVRQSEQTIGASLFEDLNDVLGIDLERDLLAQLVGPYAIAVQADKQGDRYAWGFNLSTAVKDASAVRDTLNALSGSDEGIDSQVTQLDNGFSITQGDVSVKATVENGVLRLGVRSGTAGAGGTLADDPEYGRAMEGMPRGATVHGYIALHRLLDLLPDDADDASAEYRPILDALGPIAYTAAPEGEGFRTEFAIFIK